MTRVAMVLCATLLAHPTHAASPYALPRSAVITVGRAQFDPQRAAESQFCPTWTLTAAQVRSQFRRYHLLQSNELHQFYLYPACWIDGTVMAGGRTFHWQARPGSTLRTDWPDGVEKMLGGEHSDNPSGAPSP